MPQEPQPYRLLVEGKNDFHVIRNLCIRHGLALPSIEPPKAEEGEGITALLDSLEVIVKAPRLRALGIVVDADPDPGLEARWQSVRDRLVRSEVGLQLEDIPQQAPGRGWVSQNLQLGVSVERLGIWLMPDNRVPGVLEDFVAYLIPEDNELLARAEGILQALEAEGLSVYTTVERPKARIHTWLAWQSPPGMPMGQAITAQVLSHETAIAQEFLTWLTQLFP